MKTLRMPTTLIGMLLSTSVLAAEPADQFSRANCFNNESITYNYWDPPEWRGVASWHFENGVRKHYVTPNPPVLSTCTVGSGGFTMMNGLYCQHYYTNATRHAGVHGAFASTESNPDGNLFPGVTSAWSTQGVHATYYPGIAIIYWSTSASDCNLHFDQFY